MQNKDMSAFAPPRNSDVEMIPQQQQHPNVIKNAETSSQEEEQHEKPRSFNTNDRHGSFYNNADIITQQ